MTEKTRCPWCGNDPLYVQYHDTEWGVPHHDEHALFELLTLEGAEAGLSWIVILRKRENYRRLFDGFDPSLVATYGTEKVETLMQDAGIVRSRPKILSAISNARAFLDLQAQHGTFDAYWWQWVDGRPIRNALATMQDAVSETLLSIAISKDLKKRGFSFVGSKVVYAMMQASGMVNDHLTSCFRHAELGG